MYECFGWQPVMFYNCGENKLTTERHGHLYMYLIALFKCIYKFGLNNIVSSHRHIKRLFLSTKSVPKITFALDFLCSYLHAHLNLHMCFMNFSLSSFHSLCSNLWCDAFFLQPARRCFVFCYIHGYDRSPPF